MENYEESAGKYFLFVILILSFLPNSGFGQAIIEWNFDGKAKAKAKGDGCGDVDTNFITAGPEISVVFSRLGVDLQGAGDVARQRKTSCQLDIPARVKKGYFLAELTQNLVYGYVRDPGTSGRIVVNSVFDHLKTKGMKAAIPTPGYDRFNEPFIEIASTVYWRRNIRWCVKKDYRTKLKASLALVAKRSTLDQGITIQADGFDIRLDSIGKLGSCL